MKTIVVDTEVKTDKSVLAIDRLADAFEKMADEQEKARKRQEEADRKKEEALKEQRKLVNRLSKGFKGLGLAIKAAGIGIVLGILAKMKELFEQNQFIMDKFNTVFGVMTKAVTDFIDFVTSGNVLSTIGNFFGALIDDPIKAISDGIDSVKDYTKETINLAEAQVKLANDAKIAAAEQRRIIEQYDRQAEQLRQIRDDESKTIEERVQANQELSAVLEKQTAIELKLVETQIQAAQATVDQNDNIENRVALIEALTLKDEVLARIEGFRSEQLINRVSLEKELNTELEKRALKEQDLADIGKIETKGAAGGELTDEQQVQLKQNELLNQKLAEQNKRFAKEDTKIKERTTKEKTDLEQQQAKNEEAIRMSMLQLSILMGEKSSKAAKSIAVAQVLFDVYRGIQSAFAQTTDVTPTQSLRFINAASAAAFGAVSLANILKAPTGGSGSASPNVSTPSTSAPAANFNNIAPEVTSFNEGVGLQQNSRFNNIRAFIVQQDIEDQSALSQVIKDNERV